MWPPLSLGKSYLLRFMQQRFRDEHPQSVVKQEKVKMDLELCSVGLNETLVKEAELAREKALAANDVHLLGALFSEKLVFVHSSGSEDDRHSLLEKIASRRIQYESVRLQPFKIFPLKADVWALWWKMDAKIVVSAMPRKIISSYVTVWVLEADGVLRLALHQGVPVNAV